uniref:acid phosphatase n=1 Tax=Homalodisca liturata TaxID=320908 RepID=A0A1B6JUQ5_9HEMI
MSACLIWICVPTLAVLLIFYSLTDVSKPDVDGVIASTIWSTNTLGARAAPTLQLVFIFTRHGSRGPTFTYPSCPYHPLNTNYWPNGWMALTARGHVQMYKLGLKFRSLYNGFLHHIYHPKDFQANSTLFARTMISAGQFLAGLFPSRGYQLWNKYLPWQPVPVYPTYKDHQKIAYALLTTKCPRFHEAWYKSVARFFLKYRKNITDLLEYAKPFTKIEFDESFNDTESSWMTMYTMWESFFPIIEEGIPLPSWMDEVYQRNMTFLTNRAMRAASVGSDTQIRYIEGVYFKEIMNLMSAKIEGTLRPNRKMFYFSGHDFTLLGLQGVLGLTHDPTGHLDARTGSALIFELHKDLQTDKFYVQVLYIDGASPDLEPLDINIPGCDSPCDFHLLSNITEKYYNITDWDKECQVTAN